MVRTLKEIREKHEGKVYVFCKDSETEKRFLIDAEKEGFMFGNIKPTESHQANIIALEKGMKLAHVGTAGRINYSNGGGIHIDYAAFADGEDDYLI